MTATERTIERPRVDRPASKESRGRSLVVPLATIVALIVGTLFGFLMWGMDDDSPSAVATGGDELTARQEEMVDLMEEYEAAWQRGDRAAITAMFTEDGTLTILGSEFQGDRLPDGVSVHSTLDVHEPVLVDGNRMLSFHDVSGFGTLFNEMEFTEDGEVLLVSHEVHR